MRRGVTEMYEERLVAFGKAFDRFNRVIRKRIRRVITFGKLRDSPVIMRERPEPSAIVEHRILLRRVEEIAAAVQHAVILVEAAVDRPQRWLTSEMPLSCQRRGIPSRRMASPSVIMLVRNRGRFACRGYNPVNSADRVVTQTAQL